MKVKPKEPENALRTTQRKIPFDFRRMNDERTCKTSSFVIWILEKKKKKKNLNHASVSSVSYDSLK